MAGNTAPIKKFDPLGYSTIGSDETLAWFRASELKHSRVAMLATTGYIVQAAGVHFPGMLSKDVSFESLSGMKPFDAWEAVPDAGKAQILGTIFVAELASEAQGTHYMKGGSYPTIVFPPIDFSGVSAETLKVKQDRELNNGRLAMIAIMSFIAANNGKLKREWNLENHISQSSSKPVLTSLSTCFLFDCQYSSWIRSRPCRTRQVLNVV